MPLGYSGLSGAPGRIRTRDPLVRSQVLYPTELPAHLRSWYFNVIFIFVKLEVTLNTNGKSLIINQIGKSDYIKSKYS